MASGGGPPPYPNNPPPPGPPPYGYPQQQQPPYGYQQGPPPYGQQGQYPPPQQGGQYPPGTYPVREGYSNKPIIVYPAAPDIRQTPSLQPRDTSDEFEQEQQDPFAPSFRDKAIRQRFIAKVFAILGLQLLFTFLCVLAVFLWQDARRWIIRHQWLTIVALVLYLVFVFTLTCCDKLRRRVPHNYILTAGLTIAVTLLAMCITVNYSVHSVLIAFGATAGVVLITTILSAARIVDITKCAGMITILAIALLLFMLFSTLISLFAPGTFAITQLVIAGGFLVLIVFMFMFDMQSILGGRSIELSPEEYILGAVELYIHIFTMFILILMFSGLASGNN